MQPRQQRLRVTEGEGEHDAARVEMQPVQPGEQWRPLGEQCRSKRVVAVHAAQRGGIEGVLLDRDVVQARRPPRIGRGRAPGLQEVHAQAESGLQDREDCTVAPAFRQAVAAEEDVPGLGPATVRGVKYVSIQRGPGHAARVELEATGDDGRNGGQGGLAMRSGCEGC